MDGMLARSLTILSLKKLASDWATDAAGMFVGRDGLW